jgi:hypothetical protein
MAVPCSASTPLAAGMFSARAAGNIFNIFSHWDVGVISSFHEEEEEAKERDRREREPAMRATLSPS